MESIQSLSSHLPARDIPSTTTVVINGQSTSKKVLHDEPKILNNGEAVQVFFSSTFSSTYHAPWLWSNDRYNFMLPSGQRWFSPGAFQMSLKIDSASIVPRSSLVDSSTDCTNNDTSTDMNTDMGVHSDESTTRLILSPPKIGNVHPFHVSGRSTCTSSNNSKGDTCNDHWVLKIKWKKDNASNVNDDDANDDHDPTISKDSFYYLQWLQQWSYDDISIKNGIKSREVNMTNTFVYKFNHRDAKENENQEGTQMQGRKRKKEFFGLHDVSYDEIAINENGLFDVLDSVFLDGALIVTNAPGITQGENTPVSVLGKMIGGTLSHPLYGAIFHVQSSPNANNVAFTPVELCPHQDLAYYESKPGFQFLHCVSNPSSIQGGESILIDVMAAAYTFRTLAPNFFATLTQCNATFVKERDGALLTYTRPHIELSTTPQKAEIVSVHWSPPFEGPLHIPSSQVYQYYKAYAAFELMLDSAKCPIKCSQNANIDLDLARMLSKYAKEYTWEYRLRPGEIIIFNNTRMLHGRRAFQTVNGSVNEEEDVNDSRHLVGAYTNIDDSFNRYRILLKERNLQRMVPNIGNGTSSLLPPCMMESNSDMK